MKPPRKDWTDAAAKILQEEIDREIVHNIIAENCTRRGWIGIPITTGHSTTDMSEWVHLNATGDYRFVSNQWFFEHAVDATNFALKWV